MARLSTTAWGAWDWGSGRGLQRGGVVDRWFVAGEVGIHHLAFGADGGRIFIVEESGVVGGTLVDLREGGVGLEHPLDKASKFVGFGTDGLASTRA
jgi:hypothetical protein